MTNIKKKKATKKRIKCCEYKSEMSMDATEIKINNGCAPKNALFCCHSPVCLNSSPKILPIDYQQIDNRPDVVVPVNIPDLTKLGMIDVNNIEQQLLAAAALQKSSDSGKIVIQQSPLLTPQETRTGVILRRVSPQKKSYTVKKSEPLMGVVLRKVEKNTLPLPKPRKVEHSPPPKKLPEKPISNAAAASAITKRSIPYVTSAVPLENPSLVVTLAPKPPKPVNLLRNRPKTEVYKIEGDKLIIIKHIPRAPQLTNDGSDDKKNDKSDKSQKSEKSHKHGKHRRHAKGPPIIIQAQVIFFVRFIVTLLYILLLLFCYMFYVTPVYRGRTKQSLTLYIQ